jgi:uncharacterized membrane protein
MTLRELALTLHVFAAIIWVGGMFFNHLALRPAAQTLSPELRLPLLEKVLRRFLNWAGLSVVVLFLSGAKLWGQTPPGQAPLGWQIMLIVGLIMFAIYGHLRFAAFKKFQRAVVASDWSDAARRMQLVRAMVLTNLVLGFLIIAAVLLLK